MLLVLRVYLKECWYKKVLNLILASDVKSIFFAVLKQPNKREHIHNFQKKISFCKTTIFCDMNTWINGENEQGRRRRTRQEERWRRLMLRLRRVGVAGPTGSHLKSINDNATTHSLLLLSIFFLLFPFFFLIGNAFFHSHFLVVLCPFLFLSLPPATVPPGATLTRAPSSQTLRRTCRPSPIQLPFCGATNKS